MNAIQKVVLAIVATVILAADVHAGRWLSRDPIQDGAGFVQRDPVPQMDFGEILQNEPNSYAFVKNTPVNATDPLGLVIVGFYGADFSYKWPNSGNLRLEAISGQLGTYDTVLRPKKIHGFPPPRPFPLYPSRGDAEAFRDLLRYLDTSKDGDYNPPCDDKEPIKIFGWSWGGASAVELANRIKNSPRFKDKEIEIVATIDPVTKLRPSSHTVPNNVLFFANFIQSAGPLTGGPFHGRFLSSNAQQSWQWDTNPDGKQQVAINGFVYLIDHTTIIWKVEPDLIGLLK